MEVLSVCSAAEKLDKEELLHLLNSKPIGESAQRSPVFHCVVQGLLDRPDKSNEAEHIIYLLSVHGCDTNTCDQTGGIALLRYLQDASPLSLGVLQAFCRCGSDLLRQDQDEVDCLSYVRNTSAIKEKEKEMILQFVPGLWKAVESDDAMSVRRLINQWCTIRIAKHGMTVLELAFNKGTENIIRVISGIGPSMDLAHGVIAGDTQCVEKILQSGRTVNINLQNLSDDGATPLFYAMCNNDVAMVDLLIEKGARLDVSMHCDNEDIPLYFAALSHKPPINPDLLCHTIPVSPITVDQLFFKGRNVLFHCVDVDVNVCVFEKILRQSTARLLTQRIQTNQTVRDVALATGKMTYVKIMDQVVHDWCLNQDNHQDHLKILVLHDYPQLSSIVHEQGSGDNESREVALKFRERLQDYESEMFGLLEAIKDGDLFRVKEELYSKSSRGFESCLADARFKCDGQPLLHKAVLRQETKIVQFLAETLVYVKKQKLDSIRDQYFRTALHYVYALEDRNQMIDILEDLGSSEYAMDKDGRSPMAFKDRKNQLEMKELLEYQLLQNLDYPEPDPWSVPLPMPIMGYISKCAHTHHGGTRHYKGGNVLTDSPEKLLAISERSEEDSGDVNERSKEYHQIQYRDDNNFGENWDVDNIQLESSNSWLNLCNSETKVNFAEHYNDAEAMERLTGSLDEESETSSCESPSNNADSEYEADYSEISSVESFDESKRFCTIV